MTLRKSKANPLDAYSATQCQCDICVSMCVHRPCWGTPEDAQKIIDAGLGGRLMLDWWSDSPQDIYILSPAIIEWEGRSAPFWPTGRCTFLTKDNKCELHELGLKPTEGKLAICDKDPDYLHRDVAMTWNNRKGRNLIKTWREGSE